MFLPVLMVRDYGVIGFIVFAAPNVLGAAAMGLVLREGASGRLVMRHRRAMEVFSLVTIAFHLFFLAWLIDGLDEWIEQRTGLWLVLAILAFGAMVVMVAATWQRGTRQQRVVALLLWTFGVVGLGLFLGESGDGLAALPFMATGEESGVFWLAPVCAFGFGLCPYLDLTFHRARQHAGRSASVAFLVGFGLLFPAAIGFTLAYTPVLLPAMDHGAAAAVPTMLASILVLHIVGQLVFTVRLHQHELVQPPGRLAPLSHPLMWALIVAVAFVLGFSGNRPSFVDDQSFGEVVYRCFMGLYGLAFPAYVWLIMIPTRDGHAGLSGATGRRKGLLLAFAVGVAAPMFWMGFVLRQEGWLVPGLAVVLFMRLALPRSPLPARTLPA